MIFILYSHTNEQSISNEIGMPEYSYYFVLKKYRALLEEMGKVFVINDPATEVDPIYRESCARQEYCVFLSFTPPHKLQLNLECPTIPVFAWEYSTIPNEEWKGEKRNDWRYPLGQVGWSIVHSEYAVQAVRQAMRNDYPIVSIPAPVWDEFAQYFRKGGRMPSLSGFSLELSAKDVIDSCDYRFAETAYMELIDREKVSGDHAVESASEIERHQTEMKTLAVSGVIYTAVLNPFDGRKNWIELLGTFCWAFREIEDATLILKVTHNDVADMKISLLKEFQKLSPFKCRVVAICGFLDGQKFGDLLSGTFYSVNCAVGEGQCLPLMEYLSAGKPAISPDHTSMKDYITSESAFVVRSSVEWSHWPHDPRILYRTFRYRIDLESLRGAYLESYNVAKNKSKRYKRMSINAHEALQAHCSLSVARTRLETFIELHKTIHQHMIGIIYPPQLTTTPKVRAHEKFALKTKIEKQVESIRRALGLC